jgi:hypothetical protein
VRGKSAQRDYGTSAALGKTGCPTRILANGRNLHGAEVLVGLRSELAQELSPLLRFSDLLDQLIAALEKLSEVSGENGFDNSTEKTQRRFELQHVCHASAAADICEMVIVTKRLEGVTQHAILKM